MISFAAGGWPDENCGPLIACSVTGQRSVFPLTAINRLDDIWAQSPGEALGDRRCKPKGTATKGIELIAPADVADLN